MESDQLLVSTNTTSLSEKDWDELIDFIREKFLVKNRGIKDVFESLRQRHPYATYVYHYISHGLH